jgi:hypothetical protein
VINQSRAFFMSKRISTHITTLRSYIKAKQLRTKLLYSSILQNQFYSIVFKTENIILVHDRFKIKSIYIEIYSFNQLILILQYFDFKEFGSIDKSKVDISKWIWTKKNPENITTTINKFIIYEYTTTATSKSNALNS